MKPSAEDVERCRWWWHRPPGSQAHYLVKLDYTEPRFGPKVVVYDGGELDKQPVGEGEWSPDFGGDDNEELRLAFRALAGRILGRDRAERLAPEEAATRAIAEYDGELSVRAAAEDSMRAIVQEHHLTRGAFMELAQRILVSGYQTKPFEPLELTPLMLNRLGHMDVQLVAVRGSLAAMVKRLDAAVALLPKLEMAAIPIDEEGMIDEAALERVTAELRAALAGPMPEPRPERARRALRHPTVDAGGLRALVAELRGRGHDDGCATGLAEGCTCGWADLQVVAGRIEALLRDAPEVAVDVG